MSGVFGELEKLLAQGTSADPLPWLETLEDEDLTALHSEIERRLQQRPTPLGAAGYEPLGRQLECIAGWLDYFRLGDGRRAYAAERILWLRGGDELRYLKRYARLDDPQLAYRLGCSLAAAEPTRALNLSPFLLGEPELSSSFFSFVGQLDHRTSLAAIQTALAAVPRGVRPQATAYVLAILDTQPSADRRKSFEVACLDGTSPEALWLVREGQVPAPAVANHAPEHDLVARGHWLGLAAYAALRAGDELGVIRYLKQAGASLPSEEQERIWHEANHSLRAMLTQVGFEPT